MDQAIVKIYFTLLVLISATLFTNNASAMIMTFRKLECVPEVDYYRYGSIVTTNKSDNLDYEALWQKHGLVMMTDKGVSDYNVNSMEDALSYSNLCNIKKGWHTEIKSRYIFPPLGGIQEQIQLMYGDKMVLDSINRYGCYSFADEVCDDFYFAIKSVEVIGEFFTITAAASRAELERYYEELKNKDDNVWAKHSQDDCKTYYLSISGWLDRGMYKYYNSITFPHTDEMITLPLTHDKLVRIIYMEYTSSNPRYKNIDIGHNVYKPDKCFIDISLSYDK